MNTKLKTLLSITAFVLVSSFVAEAHDPEPQTHPRVTTKTYLVNGVELECVALISRISCNWVKYERLVKECKQELAKKYPSLRFPEVKGECGE